MTLATIRSALKTIIEGASDKVRNVREYDEYLETDSSGTFDRHFRDENGDINCWEIDISPGVSIPYACCTAEHTYAIAVTGRRTRREDVKSLKAFQEVAAEVYQVLFRNRSLNNTSEPTVLEAPSEIMTQRFGDEPMCMAIVFTLEASELENSVTWS